MLKVDLETAAMDALFAAAPVYEKSVIVHAFLITEPREVVTIVGDGFIETTVTAQPGQYLIRNPGGEEYILKADNFASRYTHESGDLYRAKGRIKAFRNPTGEAVEIMAPWGKPQFGDAQCFFALALDGNGTDRYIIEDQAFGDTYAVSIPKE